MTRLGSLLAEAAAGRPPEPDGTVRVLPPVPGPVDAVLGFAAHHVVAAPVSQAAVEEALGADDLGAPLKPPFLTWLAGRVGARAIGSIDVVLVAPSEPRVAAAEVVARDDLHGHPRVARALGHRTDVRVFADADDRGVVILGRGLAGRMEVAFEVAEAHRGRGIARALVAAAVVEAAGEPLFAQTAPANAASLRALLAVGFRPIGAEVLLPRA